MITLKDTTKGMVSTDYAERFIAEYNQLVIRIKSLGDTIYKYEHNELGFELKSDITLLKLQHDVMRSYRNALVVRAEDEGIDIQGEVTW